MTKLASAEKRYEDVTWTTGVQVSAENASQIYSRYAKAAQMAAGKRVLELGCGAGQGFGLLERSARLLVGADYSTALLESARSHYRDRIPLVRLSAESLPFVDSAFDLIIFFEATYYVPEMERAFDEIKRVLAPGGTVFFSNHNPEQPGFIRSPHSHHYHTAQEFDRALRSRGFIVRVEGTFPVSVLAHGFLRRVIATMLPYLRGLIASLNLAPKTLRGRAILKRLVYGRLRQVPAELPLNFAKLEESAQVACNATKGFRAIYVFGRRERKTPDCGIEEQSAP